MTENAPTPEAPADESVDLDAPTSDDQAPEAVSGDTPDANEAPEGNPNSEAARYRIKLRETEAERDSLAERLTVYQRRECEAAIAAVLDQPDDLWTIAQADLSAFYGDDGQLLEDDLLGAAAALADMRPRLAKQRTDSPPRSWGQHSGAPAPAQGPGWADVIANS